MKSIEIIKRLGRLSNYLSDFIVEILVLLFKSKCNLDLLNSNQIETLILVLSDIKVIQSLGLICTYYNIDYNVFIANLINKKYFKNPCKILELPIDDNYLFYLLEQIETRLNQSNNDYLQGLFNLLSDKNYRYNSIGLKVILAKYLLDIELTNLKVFKIDNNYLNDNYKFLSFKNTKIKGYSKIYFIDDIIILSTLNHDNIVNIALYDKTSDINIKKVIQSNIIIENKDFKHIDLNKYKYTKKDIEISCFNQLQYLIYLIDLIKKDMNRQIAIDYNSIDINYDNYLETFYNLDFTFIYQYDKLIDIYYQIEDKIKTIKKLNQENNNLDIASNKELARIESEDYFKYEIDLKDYFLNP